MDKLLSLALLLPAVLACRPTFPGYEATSPCPDMNALEIDAAAVLGLAPPVNLVFVGCPAVWLSDPEFGLASPCHLAFKDAAGNESYHSMLLITASASHPSRGLRISAAPPGSSGTGRSETADRAVQVLLGIWLMRSFTLDEIAQLALHGSHCAERNSPAWLAALILGSLSNESGEVIEIIVCGA